MKMKRMSDNGEIIKLTKNLYETNVNTEGYLVANTIYLPFHLSFDYALSYHGLIPKTIYTYTNAIYNKKNNITTFLELSLIEVFQLECILMGS